MKKQILLLLLLPVYIFGQSDIKMQSDYGSDNQQIQNILSFEGIDYYDVNIKGTHLKDKYFKMIVKEIWDGVITKQDTIVNSKRMIGMPIGSDSLNFKVMAKRFGDDQLKVTFRFNRFGINKKFDATGSYDYSMRDTGSKMEIIAGSPFHAFAYILPYEKDGYKYWCAVEDSGKDIESWGSEFGIKHYLVFDMLFD